ncbi:MAG: zinc ABC transporter permease AztB [Microbacteriaceae bacterium]
MFEWFVEPLSSGFMSRALIAGVLISIMTALVGSWVVIRGMTFLGEAMAHGMLPGVAVASLLGGNLLFGAALSALAMVFGINLLRKNTRFGQDTAIGLLYLGMLSVGVIIVSYSQSFAVDLTAFLFGDILGVREPELTSLWLALGFVAIVSMLSYRSFLALSFDYRKAQTLGLKPGLMNLVMLLLIVVSVAASFQAVGTLLAFGMLIAPSATALLLVRRIPLVMLLAAILGSLATFIGLLISWHGGTAAGSTIVAVEVLMFFLAATFAWLKTQLFRRNTLQKSIA